MQTTNPETTEIIAQDDASPDYNLVELPVPPGVSVARNPKNLGFSGNCNTGASRASGKYLIFLNQDVKAIHPGWVNLMVALFESNENIGIVGPKLLFPDGGIQSCGGIFDGGKGPAHRYLGWKNANDWRVNTTEKVSWVTGAALMIRRDDFIELGGFDIEYKNGYFEDVDLCVKMQVLNNKEVWYCAESALVHSVGSSGGNPLFMQNSRRFHSLWDDSIVPDTQVRMVNY